MSLTEDDVKKMKVVDLRMALKVRNLDSKGRKAELQKRLLETIITAESPDEMEDSEEPVEPEPEEPEEPVYPQTEASNPEESNIETEAPFVEQPGEVDQGESRGIVMTEPPLVTKQPGDNYGETQVTEENMPESVLVEQSNEEDPGDEQPIEEDYGESQVLDMAESTIVEQPCEEDHGQTQVTKENLPEVPLAEQPREGDNGETQVTEENMTGIMVEREYLKTAEMEPAKSTETAEVEPEAAEVELVEQHSEDDHGETQAAEENITESTAKVEEEENGKTNVTDEEMKDPSETTVECKETEVELNGAVAENTTTSEVETEAAVAMAGPSAVEAVNGEPAPEAEGSQKRSAAEADVNEEPDKKRRKTRFNAPAVDESKLPPILLEKEKEGIKNFLQTLSPTALLDACADLCVKFPELLKEIKSKLHKDPKLCKLFIRGLDWETTSEKLNEVFSEYGTVVEVNVIMDKQMGRSKGYGFITMATAQEAEKALELTERKIDNRTTYINLASSPDNFSQQRKEGNGFYRGRGGGRGGGGGGGFRGRGGGYRGYNQNYQPYGY